VAGGAAGGGGASASIGGACGNAMDAAADVSGTAGAAIIGDDGNGAAITGDGGNAAASSCIAPTGARPPESILIADSLPESSSIVAALRFSGPRPLIASPEHFPHTVSPSL